MSNLFLRNQRLKFSSPLSWHIILLFFPSGWRCNFWLLSSDERISISYIGAPFLLLALDAVYAYIIYIMAMEGFSPSNLFLLATQFIKKSNYTDCQVRRSENLSYSLSSSSAFFAPIGTQHSLPNILAIFFEQPHLPQKNVSTRSESNVFHKNLNIVLKGFFSFLPSVLWLPLMALPLYPNIKKMEQDCLGR